MQILTVNNRNFQKPSRNPSNRTKVKILEKNFFDSSSKKFRVCSVTAEMFEHRNSGENRRKRSEIFSKVYEGHIRIWFRYEKNSKLSHACVPLKVLGILRYIIDTIARVFGEKWIILRDLNFHLRFFLVKSYSKCFSNVQNYRFRGSSHRSSLSGLISALFWS
jgi:hypothetical protein